MKPLSEIKATDPTGYLAKIGAKPKTVGENKIKCLAVYRDEQKPSCDWTLKGGSWVFADRADPVNKGSILDYEIARNGGTVSEASQRIHEIEGLEFNKGSAAEKGSFNILRSHVYKDASGKLILRKTKFKDGNWNTQHHDGDQWQKGAGDKSKIPLYRVSSLSDASPSEWLWLCEGEKDADSLAGLGARALASWSKKLTEANVRVLEGYSIIIATDADQAGEGYSQEWFDALCERCPEVKIIRWPEGTAKGFDVSDFLKTGTVTDLEKLAITSDEYRPLELPESLQIDNDTQRAELFADLFGETTRFVPERGS